jgi:phenylpropionate dioxygenase-like ring-hydroxylating dioxygenase large terminal subunit
MEKKTTFDTGETGGRQASPGARKPHSLRPLQNFWYFALPSADLGRGKMKGLKLCSQNILLGRTNDGKVFAMRDLCPHRGTPLHHGQFDGEEIQCHYHGWKFAPDGRCTLIPALCAPQEHFGDRIRNGTFPCREGQGIIWVFIGDRDREHLPELPLVPDIGDAQPHAYCAITYPLNSDHTAFTFFDPAHVAFVHSSPFIRRRSHTIRDKVKEMKPVGLGWEVKRHPVPHDNLFYRLFGKNATTGIHYLLPGTRIERVRGEKYWAVSVATIASITDEETVVHQAFYWNFPYLTPIKGLIRRLINHFLNEDRTYAIKQREGLAAQVPFMLIGDADAQLRWFQELRQAWLYAEAEGISFENPLTAQTLRFRS